MANPLIQLNQQVLLDMARNKEVSNEQWAQFMLATYKDRDFYNEKFKKFQATRRIMEYTVKAVIPVILGVGLFLSGPAALLIAGAAVTLSLSSLIYSRLNLPDFSIETPEYVALSEFDQQKWDDYRNEWISDANRDSFDEKQNALDINMTRIGMGLVISFATFASVVSGGSLPIIVSSALLAASLFFRHTDNRAPFLETNATPVLTKALTSHGMYQVAKKATPKEDNLSNVVSISSQS